MRAGIKSAARKKKRFVFPARYAIILGKAICVLRRGRVCRPAASGRLCAAPARDRQKNSPRGSGGNAALSAEDGEQECHVNNLSDIAVIRDVLSRHGFHFSKSLGQNFLINPGVCPRMAEECGASPETGVLEVGPGIGVLTAELARRACRVVSIELDQRLLPVLDETLAEFSNVKIVSGDVMKVDLRRLIEEEFPGMEVAVCANLPYYITSPVIMRLLEERLPIASLTVMVQKEAADRLCAPPGSRQCGAVSAAVRYYAEPRLLFQVGRGSFLPQPNVDSAVIRFDILERPPVEVDEKAFFALVKAAFGQRRKTVSNSVSALLGLEKSLVQRACGRAGVPPTARAEQLTMEQLAALTRAIAEEREEAK